MSPIAFTFAGLAAVGALAAPQPAAHRAADSARADSAKFVRLNAQPLQPGQGGALQITPRLDTGARPTPYVAKVPAATRPIKTW